MADHPDLGTRGSSTEVPRPRRSLDWPRLLRSASVDDVLEQIARWLGPPVVELDLTSPERADARIGSWQPPHTSGEPRRRMSAVVVGEPPWRLTAGVRGEPAAAVEKLERGALLVEAWRQAHRELGRADRRLAARSRELDLLQLLGRRAAESRTAEELFDATVSVLLQGEELDLTLVGHDDDEGRRLVAFLARPVSQRYLDAVRARASRFLGWPPDSTPPARRVELDSYDAARGQREEFREDDLVLLPVLRRGQPVACLLVVPAGDVDERQLRLLYSASNQLSLHLDRILTVREAEADRFRSIVGSMPQGVLVADDRLRIVQANHAARSMLAASGLSVGTDMTEALDRLGLTGLVDDVRLCRAPLAEGEARLADDRVWSVTVTPVVGERGRRNTLLLVLTDITERRRLERQVAQSEKMSSLGQMISGVAHELNNPLASIVGYAQLIRATGRDEQLGQRLDILRQEAERCRKIVRNLLSFARRREPETRPLSLNQVVETVLSLLGYQLRVDDVRVETDLSPDLPAMQGDAHQLEQMLVNLVTNAQHAIRQTGRAGVISLRTRPERSEAITLEIADSGPGIPASIRSKVFDPFFTTKSAGQGTGLGLALVYGIVTSHGGIVHTRPNPVGGTVFHLTFPLGDAADPDPQADERPLLPVAARSGRILVVDDEEPVARLICDALTGDGHVMQTARDGQRALELLASGEFDLIISDVKMPCMNGERLHDELARSNSAMSRRLLLTTGDTLGTDADELAARTGLDLLRKPFDLDDLRRAVRAKLG